MRQKDQKNDGFISTMLFLELLSHIGAVFVLLVNRNWVHYVKNMVSEAMPGIEMFVPLYGWGATLLWLMGGLLASILAVGSFWRGRKLAGVLLLAGYAFFGYALMYLLPFVMLILGIFEFRRWYSKRRYSQRKHGRKEADMNCDGD